ncbi:unnamed protein product [Spirodela intermedia]|uniref:Uncharacterized protein n=1 Tax=Spirodela intermedia TaxID=51605 RepID=A0A7I8IG27_SPIIN|nr:unnamed protein product [Spirodela intermedia]CAA6656828.1 unnamed protein product [Spirodela intermedia]
MGRLQLRSPSLTADSLLSDGLEDFLFPEEPLSPETIAGGEERSLLSREEAKLEKEIIRIVRSGRAAEVLLPNSGQSVSIGDHNICIGHHEEPGSEYRVWEWHGHIMLFDDENGFSPEYVYGNYFESIPAPAREKEITAAPAAAGGKEGQKGGKDESAKSSGLRYLIVGEENLPGEDCRRVLHRNFLSSGPAS